MAMLALMLQIISGVPFLLALRVEVYLVTQVFLGATITRALLRRRLEIFEFVIERILKVFEFQHLPQLT